MKLRYFYNGLIHTMNPAVPKSPHLLLAGDRILFCSPERAPLGLDFRESGFASTRDRLRDNVECIDLGGRVVLPGLTDAHVHFVWWAVTRTRADLTPSMNEADAVRLLQQAAGRPPAGQWIIGHGWSHNAWQPPVAPSRDSLDAVYPDNPVYLTSKCGHLQWVNSAALRAAGIDGTTANPPGGEIEMRDREGKREPSGLLKETAGSLVEAHIAPPSADFMRRAVAAAQHEAHALGLTGVHTPESLDDFDLVQRLAQEGALTMRFNFLIPVAALDHLTDLRVRHGLGNHLVRVAGVKMFADGSLGGRTALMYEPFEGEPENLGMSVASAEEIEDATLRANRAGLAMAIHAIGDRAVSHVLAAFERSRTETGDSGASGSRPFVRNRIEHLQLFAERDIPRIRSLRPVASMQPVHLCADMGPADRYWGRRARYAYACRTLFEAGCPLAFGSDAPVEPINPFYGLYAAVTRRSLDGSPENGWYPEESLGAWETLAAYTTGPALAAGVQDEVGDLSAGKLADFIVLAEDPLNVAPEQLRELLPVATYAGGKCVHAHDTWCESATGTRL
ncbi:MAG: amidohydrolase [Candidatus Sumerlaeaceae bacterium]|nr:amidohydrolase [Candidatus Sumerlaeaceae bacterium]